MKLIIILNIINIILNYKIIKLNHEIKENLKKNEELYKWGSLRKK